MEKEFIRKVKTPEEFIYVYLQDIRSCLGDLPGNAVKLLQLMWIDSEFPERSKAADKTKVVGNIVRTTKPFKEVWCSELKIGMSAMNNLITALIKEGLIIEYASPIYQLDPKRFFKGTADQRAKAIQVIYKYEIEEGI